MRIQNTIQEKLSQTLSPVHLEVVNESHSHNVPANSETHFKVVAASEAFNGLTAVKRHQQVYRVLAEELSGGVHALSLHLYTPEEWEAAAVPESPPCLGGGRK
jgi:BolA protein